MLSEYTKILEESKKFYEKNSEFMTITNKVNHYHLNSNVQTGCTSFMDGLLEHNS